MVPFHTLSEMTMRLVNSEEVVLAMHILFHERLSKFRQALCECGVLPLDEVYPSSDAGDESDVSLPPNLKEEDFEIDYDAEEKLFLEQCSVFMNDFVEKIFQPEVEITAEDKARYGLLCQHKEGRDAFAKAVDFQRNGYKEVDEFTFFRLVQYFATCLFECNDAEDFMPSVTLMNMCFTFYYSSVLHKGRVGQDGAQYLYEFLKEQPIWKCSRFWDAAFFFAIEANRMNRMGGTESFSNKMESTQRAAFELCEANSSFGHIASFLYMMKSLGIDQTQRKTFLQKMSTIADLQEEQVQQLEESAEFL